MADPSLSRRQRTILAGVFAGAVFIATILVRVPIPATNGYLNFGDAVIVLVALLFGPSTAGLAGSIGSGAADLVGFPVFAIPTFLIKGLLGVIVGAIGRRRKRRLPLAIVGAIVGELWMVVGYFLTEAVVFKHSMGIAAATSEVGFNLVQAGFGVVIGVGAFAVLRGKRDSGPSGKNDVD
jgi:uncharacterized membrane protein